MSEAVAAIAFLKPMRPGRDAKTDHLPETSAAVLPFIQTRPAKQQQQRRRYAAMRRTRSTFKITAPQLPQPSAGS